MKKIAIIIGASLLPIMVFAQGTGVSTSGIEELAQSLRRIVEILIPVVFGLGLLVFFWGLVNYIFGSEESKVSAKKTMLWGVIAIFVMAAIWGLVAWIGDLFGVNTDEGAVDIDKINPL